MKVLQIPNKNESGEEKPYHIQTPSYLLFTRLGGVPNITQDLLLRTLQLTQSDLIKDALFIHLNYWDLMEVCNVRLLKSFKEHRKQNNLATDKSTHQFLFWKNYPLFLSTFHPQFPLLSITSSDDSIQGDTSAGRQKISLESFWESLNEYQAETNLLMCDQGNFELTNISVDSSETDLEKLVTKKYRNSMQRNKKWLIKQIELLEKQPNSKQQFYMSIPGGVFHKLKMDYLKELQTELKGKEHLIHGIWLMDWSIIPEQFKWKQLEEIITFFKKEWIECKDKPIYVSGMDDPFSILRCVELGIDLFDGIYPFMQAERGNALVFDFPALDAMPLENKKPLYESMRSMSNEKELKPIQSDCRCETCTLYTKAYMYHLLNCHEMTAEVCLSVHNLHQYLKFFKTIQHHLKNGTLTQFKKSFFETFY